MTWVKEYNDAPRRPNSTMAAIHAIAFSIVLAFTLGCRSYQRNEGNQNNPSRIEPVSSIADERDEIAMLLAYAVVLKDWQTKAPQRRGYNIGCVLVNEKGKFVFSGRNCNYITQNATQHAEVRAMLGFLDSVARGTNREITATSFSTNTLGRASYLQGYTIYTTLEPCAMCAGMMTLLDLKRVVFGQKDPEFGAALERLQLDTSGLTNHYPPCLTNGYSAYPRRPASQASKTRIRAKLEQEHRQEGNKITDFLYEEKAHLIYKEAAERFNRFEPNNIENRSFLESARKFLSSVPDHYEALTLHF